MPESRDPSSHGSMPDGGATTGYPLLNSLQVSSFTCTIRTAWCPASKCRSLLPIAALSCAASTAVHSQRKHGLRRDAQKQGSHKRPFEAGDNSADSCALRGPGGGAIEGPPLLGRISAGSAHGGLEYYRYNHSISSSALIGHHHGDCRLPWSVFHCGADIAVL